MGKVSKFGVFSPAVIAAKVALGETRLNKIRGKVRGRTLGLLNCHGCRNTTIIESHPNIVMHVSDGPYCFVLICEILKARSSCLRWWVTQEIPHGTPPWTRFAELEYSTAKKVWIPREGGVGTTSLRAFRKRTHRVMLTRASLWKTRSFTTVKGGEVSHVTNHDGVGLWRV